MHRLVETLGGAQIKLMCSVVTFDRNDEPTAALYRMHGISMFYECSLSGGS